MDELLIDVSCPWCEKDVLIEVEDTGALEDGYPFETFCPECKNLFEVTVY